MNKAQMVAVMSEELISCMRALSFINRGINVSRVNGKSYTKVELEKRISELRKLIEQNKSLLHDVKVEDTEAINISEILTHQRHLKQKLKKIAPGNGGKIDRPTAALIVKNMLIIRKGKIDLVDIQKSFQDMGFQLSNWSCLMRSIMQYDPTIKRSQRGVYVIEK